MAKLMLVEDDNNLREIYGARLMAEGYEIVSASDGEEALALAVKEKPDLIISDVMMPKISGFDMLDILRTTPETKNTKVIMMTALSQPEDRQRGESLGADKYLVKSQVTLEDVVAAVHEILEDAPQSAQSNPEPAPAAAQPQPAQPTPPAQPEAPAPESPPSSAPPQPQPPADNGSEKTNNNGSSQVQSEQPPSENTPPKVDGASDAPEPASRKKKTIAPINDLTQDKDKLMQMAAEEEAQEAQRTPGADIMPPNSQTTSDSPDNPAPSPGTDGSQPPAPSNPPVNPEITQTMAAEKVAMEEEVKELLDNGTIDAEASAPTVEPVANEVQTDQPPANTPDNPAPATPEELPTPEDQPQPGEIAQPQTSEPQPIPDPVQPTEPVSPPAPEVNPAPTAPAQPAVEPAPEVELPTPQPPTAETQPSASPTPAPAPAPDMPDDATPPPTPNPEVQTPNPAPNPNPEASNPNQPKTQPPDQDNEDKSQFNPEDPRNIAL